MVEVRRTRMDPSATARTHRRRNRRPTHPPLRTHPARTRPPGPAMMKPCIDCGTPTDGTRCPTHATIRKQQTQATHQAKRNARGGRRTRGGAHMNGAPPLHSVCWICGRQATNPNDPMQWDHLTPISQGGDQRGEVAPAHRSCNITRSNKGRSRGNRAPIPNARYRHTGNQHEHA